MITDYLKIKSLYILIEYLWRQFDLDSLRHWGRGEGSFTLRKFFILSIRNRLFQIDNPVDSCPLTLDVGGGCWRRNVLVTIITCW